LEILQDTFMEPHNIELDLRHPNLDMGFRNAFRHFDIYSATTPTLKYRVWTFTFCCSQKHIQELKWVMVPDNSFELIPKMGKNFVFENCIYFELQQIAW